MKNVLSLILVLLLSFPLAACSGQKPAGPSENLVGNGEDLNTTWSANTQELTPFEHGCTVSGVARLGNHLLLRGETRPPQAEEGKPAAESTPAPSEPVLGLVSYEVESDGSVRVSDTKLLALDEPEAADEAMIHAIAAGGDGYFYVLTGEQFGIYKNPDFEIGASLFLENPDYKGRYSVLRYREDGAFLDRIRLRDWPYSSIDGIAVGSDGELVLYESNHICLMDRTGAVLQTEEIEDGYWVQSVSHCGTGLIASIHETSQLQGTYYQINSQSGLLFKLNTPGGYDKYTVDTGNWTVTQGVDGEFLVFYTRGVYSYRSFFVLDFDAGTCQEVLRWYPEESMEGCTYACRLAESTFVYTRSDGESLYVLTGEKQETQAPSGHSVVQVAVYGNGGETIRAQLNAINAADSDFFYQCTTYSVNQFDLLRTAISTGNAPDLVLFPADLYNGEPLDTNSSYFEDLFPYIDSDPELSRESFIPNLLEATSVDGRLTQLCQYVDIYSIAVRASDTGGSKTLTTEDYMRILRENEGYTAVQPPWVSRESLLSWAATLSCSIYIDKGNAVCGFDSEEFSRLLQWVKNTGGNYKDGDPLPDESNYAEYVAFLSQIGTAYRIKGDEKLFGKPVAYVGFPVGNQPGNIYSCGGYCMAIPTLGNNKEGAWEYIRTQLSFTAQYNSQKENLFPKIPVNLEAAKQLASKELSKEEVGQLIDLMSTTKYAKNYTDEPLYEIIMTNGLAYLAGDKTLEETVSLIQSRASMYMAEKYS